MEQGPSGGKEGRDDGSEAEAPRVQRFQFGPWLFNVNSARAIIAERPRDESNLLVEPWAHFYGLDNPDEAVSLFFVQHLDRDYAMTTDLEEPVLVATVRNSLNEQFPLLIDGTHRLYKAYVQGVGVLPAYVLDAEESLAIREDGFIGNSIYWPGHDQERFPRDGGSSTDDSG
jgi:hypothetical protein